MMKLFLKIFFGLGTLLSILSANRPAWAGPLSEFTIVCGAEPACNPSNCWECSFSHRTWISLGLNKKSWTSYICSASTPSGLKYLDGCSNTSGRGGLTGDSKETFIVWDHNEKTGYNCVPQNLKSMYQICYPCVIVGTLVSSFTQTAAKTYDVMKSLANVILVIGTILWLGMYVLKSVSSFATVEPMRMLQDIFIQLFKVFVAMVIANAGIDVIVNYTLVPILNTGTDFGIAILDILGGEHA